MANLRLPSLSANQDVLVVALVLVVLPHWAGDTSKYTLKRRDLQLRLYALVDTLTVVPVSQER